MKAINISICACGKVLDKFSWRSYRDLNDVIIAKVREIFPKAKVSVDEFEPPMMLKEKKEGAAHLTQKDREIRQPFIVKLSKCNLCEREGGKYFEAVFQIRGNNFSNLEKGLAYLNERVAGLRQRGLFINKIDNFENGFDLYMTSNKLAQVIAREMIDHFGGKLKISPRLFSKNHQTSRELYRVNVLVELPEFSRGDCIVYKDKVWMVDKISRKIKIIEMVNNGSEILDYEKIDFKLLEKQKAFVSRTYPHLEVINPYDYQSTMVKNKSKHSYISGQSVNIVVYKGVYVVD